jgi:hypothetical protein
MRISLYGLVGFVGKEPEKNGPSQATNFAYALTFDHATIDG